MSKLDRAKRLIGKTLPPSYGFCLAPDFNVPDIITVTGVKFLTREEFYAKKNRELVGYSRSKSPRKLIYLTGKSSSGKDVIVACNSRIRF